MSAMKEIREAVDANPETVLTVRKYKTRKGEKLVDRWFYAECVGFAQNPPRVLVRQIWAGDDDGSYMPEPENIRIISGGVVESVPASECDIRGVTMATLIQEKKESVDSYRAYRAEVDEAEACRARRVAPIVAAFSELGAERVNTWHNPKNTDEDPHGRSTGTVTIQVTFPYGSDALERLASLLGE